jgi:hypothetical protein
MNAEKRARAIARRQIMEKRRLMPYMKKVLNILNDPDTSNYQKEIAKSNFITYARTKFLLEPQGQNLVPFRPYKAWEKFYQAYRNYMNNLNRHRNRTVRTNASPSRLAVGRRNNGMYFLVNNPT